LRLNGELSLGGFQFSGSGLGIHRADATLGIAS
jgi:hypothetical protein